MQQVQQPSPALSNPPQHSATRPALSNLPSTQQPSPALSNPPHHQACLDPSSRFRVKTYNAIAAEGLAVFPSELYNVGPQVEDPHAIMMRSHKLDPEDVPTMTRAVARCGAGTNNVPVATMTDWGALALRWLLPSAAGGKGFP